ncbi:MAG TPA: hypothetical protein VI757_08365 [Bacteroidia bacterium]|nr:hypothetical protein [Bacteroidia bacterium]
MEKLQRFRHFENFHIVLWLVKDLCWCTMSQTLGVIMIFPTVALAIYITWLHRHTRVELFHNTAVVLWLFANSIWMLGEFYYNDSTRPIALVFFIAGLGTAAWYYVSEVFLKSLRSGSAGGND